MSEAASNSSFANPIPIISLGGFLSTSVMLLNGISLLMIFRNQEIPGRVKACFIGQVVTDLTVGVSTIMMILDNFEGVYCYISLYMNVVFGVITSLMALLQTLDRFLVLKMTYAYTSWMSKRKMAGIVILVYVISSTSVIGSLYKPVDETEKCYPTTSGNRPGYLLFLVIIWFCSISIVCLYIYIGNKVRALQKFSAEQERIHSRLQANNQTDKITDQIPNNTNVEQKQISGKNTSSQNEIKEEMCEGISQNAVIPQKVINTTPKAGDEPVVDMKPKRLSMSQSDMKVLITLILTASLYGICYIPLAVSMVFIDINWANREDFVAEHSQIMTFCGVLHTANSLLNPLVYIWRLKSFRVNCKAICNKR